MGKPQYFPLTPTRGSLAYQRLLASHTFQENAYPGLLDASLNPTFKFGHSPKAFEIDKQLYLACFALLAIIPRSIRLHIQNRAPWMQRQSLLAGRWGRFNQENGE